MQDKIERHNIPRCMYIKRITFL